MFSLIASTLRRRQSIGLRSRRGRICSWKFDLKSRAPAHQIARSFRESRHGPEAVAPASQARHAEAVRPASAPQFREASSELPAARPVILPGELQARLTAFRRCKSKFSLLELVTGHQCVNDDRRANQRQRHEGKPDFWSGKI